MLIKYKIVELYEDDRTMVVRYYTDVLSEKDLESVPNPDDPNKPIRCKSDVSLSIPLPEPSAVELEKLILRNAPIAGLEVLEKLKIQPELKPLTAILSMVNVEVSKTKEDILNLVQAPVRLSNAEIDDIFSANTAANTSQ
jgi:hypothetical protein